MKGMLLRNLSFCARRLRLSPINPTPSPLSVSASYRSTPTFFSSSNNLPRQPHSPHTHNEDAPIDAQDISNEELKKRVAKLQEGDADAIPSVFEAILQRYLSGKPIEADQELMREILGKGTGSEDDDEDDELDSGLEEMSDTDDSDGDFDLDFGEISGAREKETKR